ncbi:MAG: exodeoxyribonuclease VII large subunit [Acidobacteriota bacterium]
MVQPQRSEPGKVYSVSELTREIKLHLEGEFFNVWVMGEISNCKQHTSGHLYFTLKDRRSQLPAVMWRSTRRYLKFRPADGMAVVVRGQISVYEPRGSYQLQVEWMEPRGKGALQLAFEQLKEKLSREGLFAAEGKKPLPLLPQKIGIVTSPSGAAIQDLCRILHRRFPNLAVVLYPAQVQGDSAAAEITKGIQVLNRLGGFDVLIVGRGGGSLEDLWPFNEESVARAIAASKIPVISAVGHEVDFTIADFVADVRAPTPSAAAEMVVARKDDFLERLRRLRQRLDHTWEYRRTRLAGHLERLAGHQAFLAVRHAVQMNAQRLDETSYRILSLVERRLGTARSRAEALSRRLGRLRLDRQVAESRTRLTQLASTLQRAHQVRLGHARERLSRSGARLEALSPLAVLARGYSLSWDASGKLLRDAAAVGRGDPVRISLHRGELDCRVEQSRAAAETEETSAGL